MSSIKFYLLFIKIIIMEKKENKNLLNLSLVLSLLSFLLLGYLAFGGLNKIVGKAIDNNEAAKVGGWDNYSLVKEIYSSDAFKAQQKQ